MTANEMAGYYMNQYEDTDVTIERVQGFCEEYDGIYEVMTFDTSDGKHWLSDNECTVETEISLAREASDIRFTDNGYQYLPDDSDTWMDIEYVD